MYTGATPLPVLVPSASIRNLHAALNREYELMMRWAAINPDCWAHKFFHEQLFWSCQPTLVCSQAKPLPSTGLFRRPDDCRDSQWATFTTADGKFVRSVETTPMFQQWRGLVNARDLASAHQHVENFVGAQCLALYEQASEGGATASCKRRKVSTA